MWPANKRIGVLCNLKPLVVSCLYVFSPVMYMSVFAQGGANKYTSSFDIMAFWQFKVRSGWRTIEVFGVPWMGGGG